MSNNNNISNINNTDCKHVGVKSNGVAPVVDRRSKHIKVYANIHQKIHVKDKARQCGLSQSDYLLALALGYEPKAILDGRQERLLESLIGARRDLILFSNALKGSSEVRKALFKDKTVMEEWYRKVNILIGKIEDFFRRLKQPNDFDFGTANTDYQNTDER